MLQLHSNICDNYQPPSNNIATTQITLNANHANHASNMLIMLATC